MSSSISEPRAKYACEPCRRKKTKCPGEQPACSFCQRLNQKCTYTRKEKSRRIHKARNDTQNQLSRLETQIHQIKSTLEGFTDQSRYDRSSSPRGNETASIEQDGCRRSEVDMPSSVSPLTISLGQTTAFCPTHEVLSQLIDVYKSKLHLQPFPLFDSELLSLQLPQWPSYLLQSFLATTLLFAERSLYDTPKSTEIDTFVRLARQTVIPLATEGRPSVHVIKSLCLLTLCDIAVKNESRASMNISIAARLARTITHDPLRASLQHSVTREDETRCCWTIFILERTFTKGPWMLQLNTSPLIHLPSLPSPKPPSSLNSSEPSYASPLPSAEGIPPNSNILIYCLDLISLWGEVVEYMGQVRSGQSTKPWESSSSYSRIEARFYNFETTFAQIHRFKNVSLESRSPDEISKHREYWSSWFLLQITFHSGHALLNHPLFHILRHKRYGHGCTESWPPSFLQRSIDQALLHAGWTSRLLRTATDMSIQINNPLIGHQVIVCATVHLIFSFANDLPISKRAISDFEACLRFLHDISSRWPHFPEKVTALEQLENTAKQADEVFGHRGLPSSISPLLYNLIDPCVTNTDYSILSRLTLFGERVPIDHLADLHQRSKSGTPPREDNTLNTQDGFPSTNLLQYSDQITNGNSAFPEVIHGSWNLGYLGDLEPLGDL